MEGNKFSTQEEFLFASQQSDDVKQMNIANVLGRIYNISELRQIALDIQIENVEKTIQGLGINKRYSLADIISNKSSHEEIGKTLSDIDHDFYFPFVSYLNFPSHDIFKSPSSLIDKLKQEKISLTNGYCQIFNGITKPASRNLKIESVKYNDKERIISILFSCTRVIMSPNSNSTAYQNCFVSRIPALIKFIFDRELIELSLPYFYEPLAAAMKVEGGRPARFQEICNQLISYISKISGVDPKGIDFETVVLHLESNCGATDMGWQIEPQESASFDLKQNVIPLKKIFESFTATLKLECDAYGIENPLEKVHLYEIFRALKEQGYTSQMVQSVSLGPRGADVLVSLLNGDRNSTPPLLFLSERGSLIIDKLRMEIWKSQKVVVKNPYKISNLLPKSRANIIIPDIQFDQIGIGEDDCANISTAIMEVIAESPDKSVNIQKIASITGISGDKIKKVFYYLLFDGYLKATYVVYHKKCNKPISKMSNSAFDLSEMTGIVKSCVCCNQDVETEDIENRIYFWGKDANVN